MAPSFNFVMKSMLPLYLALSSIAFLLLNRPVVPAINGARDMASFTADTVVNDSAVVWMKVFEGFSSVDTAHTLNFHWAFVHRDTQDGSPTFWSFQGAVFQAWPTQQPFTVPLFTLTAASSTDFVFMVGADAQTPPVVGGFTAGQIIAWVYNTAVCDSVPLMSVNFAGKTDHYYTTDPDEHASLVAAGWTDSGVVAFVLHCRHLDASPLP